VPELRHYELPSDNGGERAAAIYSLLGTAKLNGLDPQIYLRTVLASIADHPINRDQRAAAMECLTHTETLINKVSTLVMWTLNSDTLTKERPRPHAYPVSVESGVALSPGTDPVVNGLRGYLRSWTSSRSLTDNGYPYDVGADIFMILRVVKCEVDQIT
jgi:hypothetical protein